MKNFLQTLILLTFGCGLTFCANKSQISDFTEQSHAKSAAPNYEIVFPNDKVNRVDIKIDAEKWDEMQADLKSNISTDSRQMLPPPNRNSANGSKMQEGISEKNSNRMPLDITHQGKKSKVRPARGDLRMGPPPGGRPGGSGFEPVWGYCNVYFNNQEWNKVGIRFKGNSSLRTTAERGLKKFSFKLDFDEFEDEFPEIKNQRFYGFKQLNLKNNFNDPSLIREKVAADLFTEFGLTSSKTSFCQVFVDYGEGSQYFGLYTLVEEVDDTVVETQYKGQDGNLYKPEGRASTFASGTFDKELMYKKSNKKSKDFTDVQQLNEVINSSLRTSDYQEWKKQLSATFDIDVFLKWLAANEVMQNWDTYGNTTHNYYLYGNTVSGKLEWIPWDNNEALEHGKMGGALPLSLNTVGDNWPLIRYVIDDEEWRMDYKNYVADFANMVFTPEKMTQIYDNYQQLISASVIGEQGEQKAYSFLKDDTEFYEAFEYLKSHVSQRQTLVQEFMQEQNF